MIKLKIIILLFPFILINATLYVTLQQMRTVSPEKLSDAALAEPYIEYTISPKYSREFFYNTDIPLPFVQIQPWEKKYFLMLIKENFDVQNNLYNDLTIASKRIAELERWGSRIPIEKGYKNIFQLEERKTTLTNTNSWEAILSLYINRISSEFEHIKGISDISARVSRLNTLRNYIDSHEYKIDTIIPNLQKKQGEKQYLKLLTDSLFRNYKEIVNGFLPEYDPHTIFYPVKGPADEKEFGTYEVRIDNIYESEFIQNNIRLNLNGTIMKPSNFEHINFLTIFKNIVIDSKASDIKIELPSMNIVRNTSWKKDDKNSNKYYLDVPITKSQDKYYVRFPYTFKVPVTLQYEILTTVSQYDTKKKKYEKVTKSTMFFNKHIFPDNTEKIFRKHIQFLDKKDSLNTRFVIISSKALSQAELSKNIPELIPIYEPDIKLERKEFLSGYAPKISYLKLSDTQFAIQFQNVSESKKHEAFSILGSRWTVTSEDENVFIATFWPSQSVMKFALVLNGSFIFSVLVAFMFHRYPYLLKNIGVRTAIHTIRTAHRKLTSHIKSFTIKIVTQYRFYFLLFSIMVLFFFIFFTRQHQNTIAFLGIGLWLVTLIAYRIKTQVSFALVLGFLATTALLFMLRSEILAEKTAISMYLLLITGLTHKYFTARYSISNSHTLRQFFVLAYNDGIPIIHSLANNLWYLEPLFKPLVVAKNIIVKIYGPRPRTKRDYAVLTGKLLLTLIVFFVIHRIMFTISQHSIRVSRNPEIKKLEPGIAYPSTRIVITGESFGWKNGDVVALKYGADEVNTDLWTDTKLIFTVPLHWKPGEITLFIEKLIFWDNKFIPARSKQVKIKLIPRHDGAFTPDDDAFFQQLKYLDKETLEINSYTQ